MPLFLKIEKDNLRGLLSVFSQSYRIIGPQVLSGTIVLEEIKAYELPLHYIDQHGQGTYRLLAERSPFLFSFSTGPDSFKKFLFPPERTLFHFGYNKKRLSAETIESPEKPLLLFGLRACDTEALRLYDRVLSDDREYRLRRDNSIIVAINCPFPHENCFCSSLSTGPQVKEADIIITELSEYLLLEVQSEELVNFIRDIPHKEINGRDLEERDNVINDCRAKMNKQIDIKLLKQLTKKFESPLWQEISERDLECGNCTQVCPTCFCNSTFDRVRLSDISKTDIRGSRIRVWDSCFSRNFARVHGGNFRPSRRARYRHWFMHKFLYMEEQFGLRGCVGCGRCITWCPAGIDITEVLRRLHE